MLRNRIGTVFPIGDRSRVAVVDYCSPHCLHRPVLSYEIFRSLVDGVLYAFDTQPCFGAAEPLVNIEPLACDQLIDIQRFVRRQ